jgi:HK97 family phage prohead protease/HK97 family phage major capsid protein
MKSRFTVKAAPPPGDSAVEFVMSDDSVDRMGDVIEPKGWNLDNFAPDRNPVALFNHKSDQVIGNWRDVRVVKNRLLGRLELAARGTSELVDTVRALVEQGVLRAVSVGFRPTKMEPLDAEADENWGPFRFLQQELLECSLVAVPANANALALTKSMNLPRDVVTEIFSKPANKDPLTGIRTITGKPAKYLAPIGAKMATRSQRIEAAQQSIVQMRDRVEQLDAQETRTDSEQAELDSLTERLEQTRAALEEMIRIERAVSGEIGKTTTPRAPAVMRNGPRRIPDKPGELVFKAATAFFVAKMTNKPLADVLHERYPGNDDIGMVLRTAMAPAVTGIAGWAAELSAVVLADFINLLPRSAIFPTLSSRGPSFTFGQYGTIKIPARVNSPKINGSFVGEGQAIPVRKFGLTSILLTPKKMAVISEFTKEMAQHSTPAIEGVIRQAILDDTAEALDTVLIDNVIADGIRPQGLIYNLSSLTPSTNTTPYLKIIDDITTLIAPIAAQRGGRDMVLIMNIAQYNKIAWAMSSLGEFVFDTGSGQVRNVSLVWSTTVPAARLIMVDAADFASVTGDTAEFDVSEVATIHEEDTAPLPIVGGTVQPPAIGSVAAPVRSLWQTGSIGIRMLMPMNWTMRRTGMVTFMDAVTW